MPVSSGPQLNLPKTIAFAVASLAAGIGLLFVIVWLTGSGDVQVKLGDDVFRVGDAQRFAEIIEEDRGPLLFTSLSNSRPIYVQHVGDDPLTGWSAIDARSPSDPDGCETGLVWEIGNQVFRDSCSPENTYPPNGEGLLLYGASVDAEGELTVDLDQDTDTPADADDPSS